MTETEIVKANQLIAVFMGGKTGFYNVTDQMFYRGLSHGRQVMPAELKYHSLWEWIMPVVEKISRIEVEWEDGKNGDTYYPRTFGMLSDEGKPMVRLNVAQLFEADTLLEATYLAVVDFVQFYKTQP